MGRTDFRNENDQPTVTLDADTGTIEAGGNGQHGTLILRDKDEKVMLYFNSRPANLIVGGNGEHGEISVLPASSNYTPAHLGLAPKPTIKLEGSGGVITLKGDNEERVRLGGQNANIWLGGNRANGDLVIFGSRGDNRTPEMATAHISGETSSMVLRNERHQTRLVLDGANGEAVIGGEGVNGKLRLYPSEQALGNPKLGSIRLDADDASVTLRDSSGLRDCMRLKGSTGQAFIGGGGVNGELMIFDFNGDNKIPGRARVSVEAISGTISIRDGGGNNRVRLGDGGKLWLGGHGEDGSIRLFHHHETDNLNEDRATIWLNGRDGDISLQNADCAEDFDIAESAEVAPGTVMVLDGEGKLQPSGEAYDKRVAGVISGAGDFKPGIVLDKKESPQKRMPLALVGKVYCQVDAQFSPVEVGDLLTTSPTSGYAMKAVDPLKAFGSVIGKALRPLPTGRALIPILIALQ